MSTMGTFDSFTASRLGIYSAMQGLKVTGNNISNINTAGYTRQRVDQYSLKTGVYDRYKSMMDNHIGSGSLVKSISQIRDPYLDIRYRDTTSDVGYSQTMLSGLQEIAAILDEVGKGGNSDETYGDGLLYAGLQKLAEQLRAFSADPTKDNDTLVRSAAETLTSLFRNYADRLQKLYNDTQDDYKKSITAVNEILTNIQGLNKSIRECEIAGDKALEMRDERNRQIDALSEYMNIKVEYTMEDVGAGIQVEKLTIYLGNSNPDPSVETDSSILVDGLYATQLSVPEQKPVLNQNKEDYLQGYLYLKEAAADSDEVKALQNAGITLVPSLDEDGNQKTNDDGELLFLVGTNDAAADGIVTEENDNFTIQLGKLKDILDNEWKKTTTTWGEAAGGTNSVTAVYSYTLTSANWANGDKLSIGGTDYEVGTGGLTEAIANDPAQMAAFIVSEMNKQGLGGEYTIKASGDKIIYTAKNPGAVPGNGAAAAPNPTVTNGGGQLQLDPDPAGTIAGVDSVKPNATDIGASYDEFGNKTVVDYVEMSGKWYRIQVDTEYTREIALDDNDLHGKLQAQRELLTGEGEFASAKDVAIDEGATTERGIPYYQKSFDLLAQKFAEAYNQLNQGFKIDQNGNYLDKDNKVIPGLELAGLPVNKNTPLTAEQKQELIDGGCFKMDENGDAILDKDGNKIADLDRWLEAKGAVKMGGVLFSNSGDNNDPTGITAANISVSHDWTTGAVQLVPKFEVIFADDDNPDGIDQSTLNVNANHMVTMIDKALTYDPRDLNGFGDAEGPVLFTGSFNDMFSNMMGVEASYEREMTIKLQTSYTTQVELDSNREGVSGVDLNDEAMNMMTYQKAYSAACRLMTVIDSVLDRLINNTGVTL